MKREVRLELTEGIKRLKVMISEIVNSRFVGSYKSVFRGRGLEFEDYRKYTPDDDASTIDWRASVRSKQLLIREFIEERNLNVFLLIDVSSSMVYSSISKLKMEYAGELAAALSYVVIHAGDSVGFALFNDKIVRSAPPAQGFIQYNNLVRGLVNPDYYGGKFDLINALKFLLAFLKERSIVVIISDFIGLKNEWERYIKIVSTKYDLIGIMIRDPRDFSLPEYRGRVMLEDPFSQRQMLIKTELIKDAYEKYAEKQAALIEQTFLKAGANFVELTTSESFVTPIINLFIRRSKRVK